MINDKMSWSLRIEIRRKNESLRGTLYYVDVMRLIDPLSPISVLILFFITERTCMSDVSFKIPLMIAAFTFVKCTCFISNFRSVVNSRIKLTSYFMKTLGANVRTRYLITIDRVEQFVKTVDDCRITNDDKAAMSKILTFKESNDIVSRINNSRQFNDTIQLKFRVFAL